jgi:pentatricopeptide repeat protein
MIRYLTRRSIAANQRLAAAADNFGPPFLSNCRHPREESRAINNHANGAYSSSPPKSHTSVRQNVNPRTDHVVNVTTEDKVRIVSEFVQQCKAYANKDDGAKRPQTQQLRECVHKLGGTLEEVKLVDIALAFVTKYPECRGLVDRKSLFNAIQTAFKHNQVPLAEELLRKSKARESKLWGIVVSQYVKQKNIERVEALLAHVENEHIQNQTGALDVYLYNLLLKVYLETLGRESYTKILATLKRMAAVSIQLNDAKLQPDSHSYTFLMRSMTLRGDSPVAMEAVLNTLPKNSLESDPNGVAFLQSITLQAWARSDLPDALERAEALLKSFETPSTYAYNIMLNMLANRGHADAAETLYEEMKASFNNGLNPHCCPATGTMNLVLKAFLQSFKIESAGPGSLEKAERFFQSIEDPDNISYSTMIQIFFQTQDMVKAMAAVEEMDSAARLGINSNCQPDKQTYIQLLHSLEHSDAPGAKAMATKVHDKLVRLKEAGRVDGSATNQASIGIADMNATIRALQYTISKEPTIDNYNLLLRAYLKAGMPNEAVSTLYKMKVDYELDESHGCWPNLSTYSIILHGLRKQSNNLDSALKQAIEIFESIPQPDTVVYNELLSLYAERGKPYEVIRLIQQMQQDFDSNSNPHCKPEMNVIHKVKRAILVGKTKTSQQLLQKIAIVRDWFERRERATYVADNL